MLNDLRDREFTTQEARLLNPLQLALIGDGVYELFIRNYILSNDIDLSAHKIHVKAIGYVKAKSQSTIMHHLEEMLTEEECYIFKRGRNAKSATVPKNADVRDYRMATGFEALIGYLYLIGAIDRMKYLLEEGLKTDITLKEKRRIVMAKRENPRRKEREFNKLQEKTQRLQGKRENKEYKEYKRERVNAPIENVEEVNEDLVLGRNAVIETLKSDRTVEYICVSKGDLEGSVKVALGLAKDKGIVVKEVDRRKLDSMCNGANHQGVIAKVTPFKYSEVSDILNYAKRKDQKPFIIILDEIEDPHNLGSIIRTAELCGAHGIIIPKRRNVGVTSTVYKCSVGAIEHMRIAKVTNINATIDQLKEQGVWIYGADIDGRDYSYNVDFSGPCALIIGSEGKGISKLTIKKCDVLVKIPMVGKINSLNASVAGGIMMYEVLKGRLTK